MTHQPSPTNLSDELDSIMLKYMHGSGWNGHIEADVYQDAKREIMSAITTAYAEAIRSAVPEKLRDYGVLVYKGVLTGGDSVGKAWVNEQPPELDGDYAKGFAEAIDTFTTNLKNQGLLPNGKDE